MVYSLPCRSVDLVGLLRTSVLLRSTERRFVTVLKKALL